jgi:hypothetical protein
MESTNILGYRPFTEVRADKLLIRLHLLKMELYLKLVSTDHLDDTQKSNRENVISILRQYRQNNDFPTRNVGLPKLRLPMFVGSNGAPCAMGYILQQTGEINLYNEISTNNNDIYVEDIRSNDYDKWLFENGMTKVETAAIQPGYPGTTKVIYEIVNPFFLWGITVAISCLILLWSLFLLNRIAHKQPVRIVSAILLTIVSFFLGFNITHYLLKSAPADLVEICVSENDEYDGYVEPTYSPAGCEDKINPWTPSKEEYIGGGSLIIN